MTSGDVDTPAVHVGWLARSRHELYRRAIDREIGTAGGGGR